MFNYKKIKYLSVFFILLITIIFSANMVFAQKLSQRDDILRNLQMRYGNTKSIKSNYTRTTVTKSMDQLMKTPSNQTASGILFWTDPTNLLLEQNNPEPETMVTDGKTLWWYIPAESLVYRYKNIDMGGEMKPLLNFLSGLGSLEEDFEVTLGKKDPNRPAQHRLNLQRKVAQDGLTSEISLWCNNNYELTGFQLKSISGEVTDFYLSNIEVNPQINNSIFKFKIPSKAQVVEE